MVYFRLVASRKLKYLSARSLDRHQGLVHRQAGSVMASPVGGLGDRKLFRLYEAPRSFLVASKVT